jgi:hypothetical protein
MMSLLCLRDTASAAREYNHVVHRDLTTAALLLVTACVGGCCRNTRSPGEIAELARQEQARRARLPTDGRELDARWEKLRATAQTTDGVIVGSMTLQSPKVRLFSYDRGASSATKFPDTEAALRKLAPIDVNDIDIYDGQVVVAEMAESTKPELWIHDLEVSLENVGTRPRLRDKEPVLLTVRARGQCSGTLVGFITVDPWGNGLDFGGRMRLTGLLPGGPRDVEMRVAGVLGTHVDADARAVLQLGVSCDVDGDDDGPARRDEPSQLRRHGEALHVRGIVVAV